ncbi:hypothetical protein [Paenibacillus sp. NPDC093718]|uniref:hypothetical protein n=1 Tax=Paenibacillus sp. NPDC093718 TaxID=3390601 RepID=UPI003D00CCCA
MEITAKEAAQQLHEIMKSVRETYERNSEELTYCDAEYIDLTHALEFLGQEQIEFLDLTKQLQDNRRRRRRAKDENERLQPLYDLVTQNTGIVEDVNKGRRKVQDIIKTQAARSYKSRVRNDMQFLFDEARAASRNNPTHQVQGV